MITNSDIAKLAKVLATKEDVSEIYEKFKKVDERLDSLTTATDGLAKQVSTLSLEYKVIANKLGIVNKDTKV